MVFQLGKNKQVLVTYDQTTHLTIIMAYKDATKSSECFVLGAWTTYEQNNNIKYLHKYLFKG